MKKIMFNDKYGLTKAVLEGRKTQTRRNAKLYTYSKLEVMTPYTGELSDELKKKAIDRLSAYKIGEEVAVAQSYFDCGTKWAREHIDIASDLIKSKGYNNKLFVRADLMPHRIRITNIRVERLQDISDEDCLKEGIMEWNPKDEAEGVVIKNLLEYNERNGHFPFQIPRCWNMYNTPRQAFASLIDETCGKGTWEKNPYVFVYDFELVK